MDKRKIVRIELLLLGVLAVLLIGRVFQGLPLLDGEVTINDVEKGSLYHKAFSLSEAAQVSISAFGSIESTEAARSSDAAMAAYPWIVRRSDRSVVWKMDPVHSEVEEGTLLKADDVVSLPAGDYDLYFASYGTHRGAARERSFFGVRLGDHWTGDHKRWQVALEASNGELTEIDDDLADSSPAGMDNVIWTSGTMRDDRSADQILEVSAPIEVSVYSIGEICAEPRCGDFGMIENLATHEPIWRLSKDNARPAGGSASNFVFDGTVTLQKGIYRASYTTDAAHAYGRWHGNPPYDPTAWGLTIYAADKRTASKVKPFDVWAERQPLIKLAPAGSDVQFEQSFEVERDVDVLLYAMGEIDGDSRYDYGWLDNVDSGELVWTMGTTGISHAGGSRDNSIAEGYVSLAPGRYMLHYTSDGSHAYGDWRRNKPDHEERWGITLFGISDESSDAIDLISQAPKVEESGERHEVSGLTLFSLLAAGNDQSVSAQTVIDERSRIHIRAIGEISQSGEYDYGWIQEEPAGNIIWKMSRANTVPAGGDERFRLFDDIVVLDAGTYSIHFETDESHAFGDFRDVTPDHSEEYGMSVVLLEED